VIRVRVAVPEDAAEAARVHTKSSRAAYAGIASPDTDGLSRRTGSWRRAIDAPDCACFVAEEGSDLVGVLIVGPARDGSTCGELQVLYVDPDRWGSGAGQLLIEQAHLELAKSYEEAVLTVLAANPRARRFYERNGWVLDVLVDEPHFGGRLTEVARYRKTLSQD
jgi:GNAT superfamily N-acetyltransferase